MLFKSKVSADLCYAGDVICFMGIENALRYLRKNIPPEGEIDVPRKYQRKNRYCRNTKFSEEEFAQALGDFMGGLGAAACAKNVRRSERSVRDMFSRFRDRLMEDEMLTGWMGGGKLPATDDPVWPAIYDCLFHCRAYVDDRVYSSPTYVAEYRGVEPDGDHSQKVLTFVRQRRGTKCTTCPIRLQFKFDVLVREVMGKHMLRVGGIPRENFKPHYFEIMLRAALTIKNKKFRPPQGFDQGYILRRLAEDPL